MCTSRRCAINGSTGACLAASCSDGLQNGYEPSTDCGGGACNACSDGRQCYTAADCISGVCSNIGRGTLSACRAPSCFDGVVNGGETDIDCGNTACSSPCTVGYACNSRLDCLTGSSCNVVAAFGGGGFCAAAPLPLQEPAFSAQLHGTLRISGARKRDFDAKVFATALAWFIDVAATQVAVEALRNVQAVPPEWGEYAYPSILAANNATVSIDPLDGAVTYMAYVNTFSAARAVQEPISLPKIIPTHWITTEDTVTALLIHFTVYTRPDDAVLVADRTNAAINGSGRVFVGGWEQHRGLVRNATVALDTAWYCARALFNVTSASTIAYANETGIDCTPYFIESGALINPDSNVHARYEFEIAALLPEVTLGLNRSSDGALAAVDGSVETAVAAAALAVADAALWRRLEGNHSLQPSAPTAELEAAWSLRLGSASAAANATFNPWVGRLSSLPLVSLLSVLVGMQKTTAAAVAATGFTMSLLNATWVDKGAAVPTSNLFPARLSVLRQPRGTPSAPLYGDTIPFAVQVSAVNCTV